MPRKVAVVAGGLSYFSKARRDKTQEELAAEAARMALIDNDINLSKDDIDGTIVSYFSDHFENQLLFGSIIQDYLGFNPKPSVRIEGGGATGGLAVRDAYAHVASGLLDVAMVIGFEKMSEVNTAKGNEFIALASDTDWDFPIGGFYSGYYALMAKRHMEEFGTTEEQMAMVAVKNRNNAQHNKFAQTNPKMNPYAMKDGGKITVDDVLKSPYVAFPLKRLDICLMSDGAAVMILASEEKAKKITDTPIWITGTGAGTDAMRAGDRPRTLSGVPMLPHEKKEWYKELEYPGVHSFRAGRESARQAYKMAGITNPLKQLDLIELHDAYTSSEIQTYEDLGLTKYGQGGKLIEEGVTALDGDLPVNPSGGLIGAMHAVGATGVMQGVEMFWQLQGVAGKFHGSDKTQIKNAERGLIHSHAGTGTYVTATIMER